MISEWQIAMDLGMRLRLAGLDYKEDESLWEYYTSEATEVSQGNWTIEHPEPHFWCVRGNGPMPPRFWWFGDSYGKAMDVMVEKIIEGKKPSESARTPSPCVHE